MTTAGAMPGTDFQITSVARLAPGTTIPNLPTESGCNCTRPPGKHLTRQFQTIWQAPVTTTSNHQTGISRECTKLPARHRYNYSITLYHPANTGTTTSNHPPRPDHDNPPAKHRSRQPQTTRGHQQQLPHPPSIGNDNSFQTAGPAAWGAMAIRWNIG